MKKIVELQNPDCISQREIDRFFEKLGKAFMLMAMRPANGGNPFLYSLVVDKDQVITDTKEFSTAATDGLRFYWHVDFIREITVSEIVTVQFHETGHVYSHHCEPEMNVGKLKTLTAIFWDMWVNAMVEKDHLDSGRANKYHLWTEKFGTRVDMAYFKEYLSGQRSDLPKKLYLIEPDFLPMTPNECYMHGFNAWVASPRCCKLCLALSLDPKTSQPLKPKPWGPECCQGCGAAPGDQEGGGLSGISMDSHLPSKISRSKKAEDLLRARTQSNLLNGGARGNGGNGIGNVPGLFEAALQELEEPTLLPSDFAFQAFQRKSIVDGDIKDRSRSRRRRRQVLSRDENGQVTVDENFEILVPKRKGFRPSFVWLQDTSGSMSDEDMASCISEATTLLGMGAVGTLIPCDCQVYWDKAVDVSNVSDLSSFRVHGRGGTDFDSFFKGLRENPRYRGVDLVVVATDGFIPEVPAALAPPCDVIWIVTKSGAGHLPVHFGNVVHIHGRRLATS